MSYPLDPRLQAVYEAVRPGSVAADVGADHGYLICALVADGKCPRGFACDVREQPLDSARSHVRELGLQDRVTAVLSDGLRELPGDEVDDVILAGMGGELIGELLTAVPWTRNGDKRFVLQPMTRAAQLRRTLYREGFALQEERAAAAGRFVYTVMTAAYTGEHREIGDGLAHGGLLLGRGDPLCRRYLAAERERLLKKAGGLAHSGNRAEAVRLRQLAEAFAAQ